MLMKSLVVLSSDVSYTPSLQGSLSCTVYSSHVLPSSCQELASKTTSQLSTTAFLRGTCKRQKHFSEDPCFRIHILFVCLFVYLQQQLAWALLVMSEFSAAKTEHALGTHDQTASASSCCSACHPETCCILGVWPSDRTTIEAKAQSKENRLV